MDLEVFSSLNYSMILCNDRTSAFPLVIQFLCSLIIYLHPTQHTTVQDSDDSWALRQAFILSIIYNNFSVVGEHEILITWFWLQSVIYPFVFLLLLD